MEIGTSDASVRVTRILPACVAFGVGLLTSVAAVPLQPSWNSVTRAVSGGKITSLVLTGAAVTGVDLGTGRRLPDSSAQSITIKLRLPDAYLRVAEGPYFTARDGFDGAA